MTDHAEVWRNADEHEVDNALITVCASCDTYDVARWCEAAKVLAQALKREQIKYEQTEREVAIRETALTLIVDLALDEPAGLNFAARVSAIARKAIRYEQSQGKP